MKPAVPSEIRPVYPVRMLSAIAASENTRIGIITEESTKLDPVSGITTKAKNKDDRDADTVLAQREHRGVRLVGRLELSGFAVEHVRSFRFAR